MSDTPHSGARRVAFVGLGVMGYPMAGHLAAAGYEVTVFNRTQEKAKAWCEEHGGNMAPTPAAAAQSADIAFLCVGNDNDVRDVAIGDDGVLAALPAGALLVDHTTASAELAVELNSVASERGCRFLDAPVSGGEAGAVNGALTVMIGGSEADFRHAQPVIDSYAKAQALIGPVGHGQKAKMVNQICIAGLVQGLAEALNFARAANLDIEQVIRAISRGAAQSWQMENRYATMVAGEYDFGFAVDWMRKDLNIAMNEADRLGVDLPVTKIVDGFYQQVQQRNGGRWDTSSLIDLLSD